MSATSSAIASASASAASASASSSAGISAGPNFKIIGIILAIASGVLIGCSFVFKKKGLLRSQAGQVAGEGVAYLKSPLWWSGMIMMILGEICNFVAYAFAEALVVTPLGALSVVISAILSSIFLKEKLTFFGWMGCTLCILGSVIIALNGPQEETISQIRQFQALFISASFLVYIGVLIVASLAIIIYFGPRYGTKSMIWYILVCSMIGGISVSVTTGLGSAIVETLYYHDNQFNKGPFIYFLIIFIIVTLLTEVYYLNKALALFNTAMVTPTYYVIFTFFSMMTTIVLFRGLKAPASQIITLVMGFLVICVGITILQMSKVDPEELASKGKLDRRSTLLLQAARQHTGTVDAADEKSLAGIEDPGMDALRGSFGTVGSIIRARSARRLSMASSDGRSRVGGANSFRATGAGLPMNPRDRVAGLPPDLERHQLFDPPVPAPPPHDSDAYSMQSRGEPSRKQTIKFGAEDVVHEYRRGAARGADDAVHTSRPSALAASPRSGSSSLSPSLSSSTSDGTAIVSSDESARTTAGSGTMSSTSTVSGLPSLDYERSWVDGLRTAPAGAASAPYYDPFAGSPVTATGASFAADDVDTVRAPRRPAHGRESSSRSARSYPRGDRADDAEESLRLVDDADLSSTSEDDEHRRGGIRLVKRL